jgi:hypothetical protein
MHLGYGKQEMRYDFGGETSGKVIEGDVMMDGREIFCEDGSWIELAQV